MSWQLWQLPESFGGTMLEITSSQSRFFIDFGTSPQPALAAKRTITDVTGFFREFSQHQARNVDIVLPHLDTRQRAILQAVPAGVTVYLSERSAHLHELLQKIGAEDTPKCQVRALPMKGSLRIGDSELSAYVSDAEVTGAVTLFLQTPTQKIICVGAFRFSGYHPERVHRWIEKAIAWQPDLLFLAGTHQRDKLEQEKQQAYATEQQLVEQWQLRLKEQRSLFFINMTLSNVERMRHILEASRRLGRELVFEAAHAAVLEGLYPQVGPLTVLKETVTATSNLQRVQLIDLTEIKINPRRYSIQNSMTWLSFLKQVEAAFYFDSRSLEGNFLGQEKQALKKALREPQITYIPFETSNSASQTELIAMLMKIGPKAAMVCPSLQTPSFKSAIVTQSSIKWLEIESEERGTQG